MLDVGRKRCMKIEIDADLIYHNKLPVHPSDIGLKRKKLTKFYEFAVVDEEVFFLAVIKYGIPFVKISE